MTADLFGNPSLAIFKGRALPMADACIEAIAAIAALSPFRRMKTPGGRPMSVEITNCGAAGWITDRDGYRYVADDPLTGRRWPAMPPLFHGLAADAARHAGYEDFDPDACLVNRYAVGARMGLHRDSDEADFSQPIVSVSLGLPAVFLWGGVRRAGTPRRILLEHGDVVAWGCTARLAYHGIAPLADGEHPATGPYRYNLTFRRAR